MKNSFFLKSCIRETPNLSLDADSSTDIFFPAGAKNGADKFFFGPVGQFGEIIYSCLGKKTNKKCCVYLYTFWGFWLLFIYI